MDLRTVLGEAYREDMTLADVETALQSIDLVDPKTAVEGMVAKSLYDKATSELSSYKKQLRAKQSEDERAQADKAAADQKLLEELESLRRDKQINQHLNRYLKLGYDEKLAQSTAEAMVNQDFDTVFANQQAFLAAHDKAVQKERVLSGDKRPPAGDGPQGTDYVKLAAEAGAAQNFSAQAYYLRLAQQQNND